MRPRVQLPEWLFVAALAVTVIRFAFLSAQAWMIADIASGILYLAAASLSESAVLRGRSIGLTWGTLLLSTLGIGVAWISLMERDLSGTVIAAGTCLLFVVFLLVPFLLEQLAIHRSSPLLFDLLLAPLLAGLVTRIAVGSGGGEEASNLLTWFLGPRFLQWVLPVSLIAAGIFIWLLKRRRWGRLAGMLLGASTAFLTAWLFDPFGFVKN